MSESKLTLGDPQGRTALLLQPGGKTEMIRMAMCDDLSGQSMLRQQLAPVVLQHIQTDAGIDSCPALSIFDQPEIDVVKRKWQRHTNPANAWCDIESGAGAW